MFRAAAQDKKLPEDLKTEVEELLLLGADKDRLCDYIRYVSKKNLDKKNLFNIYDAAIKQQREISRERALMLIQKVYGELFGIKWALVTCCNFYSLFFFFSRGN